MKVYNVTIDPSRETIKFTNYASIREFLEDLNADPVTDDYGQETDSRSWERLIGSKSLLESDVRINVEWKSNTFNQSYHDNWDWKHNFHCYGDNNIFVTADSNQSKQFNNKTFSSPGVFEGFTFKSIKMPGDWNAGDRCHSIKFKNCVIVDGVKAGIAGISSIPVQYWNAYASELLLADSIWNTAELRARGSDKCIIVGGNRFSGGGFMGERMYVGPVEFVNCIFRNDTSTPNVAAFVYEPGRDMRMGLADTSLGETSSADIWPSFNVKFIHCDLGNGYTSYSNASAKTNDNSLISIAGKGRDLGSTKSFLQIAAEDEMIDEIQSHSNAYIEYFYQADSNGLGLLPSYKDFATDEEEGGLFKLRVINCFGGNGGSPQSFNGGNSWLTTAIAGFSNSNSLDRAKAATWEYPGNFFLSPDPEWQARFAWDIGGEGNLQTRYALDDNQFDTNSGTFEKFQMGNTQRGMFYNPRNYYSDQQHQPANVGPLHVSRGEEPIRINAPYSPSVETVRFTDHPENDLARQTWNSWDNPAGYRDRNVITGAEKDIFGTTRSKDVLPGPIQTMSVWAEPLQLTINSSYPANNGTKSRTNRNFYYTLGCTNKPRGFESDIATTILYMVPNENKTPVRSLTEAADTNLLISDLVPESESGFSMDNGGLFQQLGSFLAQVQNSDLDSGVAMTVDHIHLRDDSFTQKEKFKLDFGKLDHGGSDGTPTILPSDTNFSWFIMAKTKGGPVGTADYFFTTEPARTISTNTPDPLAGLTSEVVEYKQVAVKRKTESFTVFADDASGMATDHYIVFADGSAVSATLPEASAQSMRAVTVTKSTGASPVGILAAAGDTVHDQESISLTTEGESVVLVSDGNNWVKLPVDYLQIERGS